MVSLYDMNEDFLKDLNLEQQEAVKEKNGPMIILAGAGSGKTRVLTYKVINLIMQGVNPFNILMVTFTNKAASEMKERMINFFSKENINISNLPTISTFHALCAKILRIEGTNIGISINFLQELVNTPRATNKTSMFLVFQKNIFFILPGFKS